ncbi:MAG: phosphotransferase [Gemmatimonadetes bacterium]|nr:phosphotransferase [Gemmatimonadota bacterium]
MTASELPSYVDQNFELRDRAGAEFVLKIMNSGEDPALLEAQVSVLDLLQAQPGRFRTPRLVRCSAGPPVTREGNHAVWLVTYLPGRLLADLPELPAALLHDLGRGLGELDRRLAHFDDPGTRRAYRWDLRNAPGVEPFTEYIADDRGRREVRARLARFAEGALPVIERLPFQVIHNDANDHNVLVKGDGDEARVSGLLDFGDIVWTARACEPAIAMTYPMMSEADPLEAGARVIAGYHAALPLKRSEVRAIPYLIEARLCVSVTMSAYRLMVDPANAYLAVSEVPAWHLLDWMSSNPPSGWVNVFEDACESVSPMGEDAP